MAKHVVISDELNRMLSDAVHSGQRGSRALIMDFLENCLCVWSWSVRSAGSAAFLSKWHLEGLNHFSGVEAFI